MLTYPKLTKAEQASLPKLLAEPISIPSRFKDSTHKVWHCQTAEGEMVLKVCNPDTVGQSAFWLGLNHLFGADFPNSLGDIQHTHDFLQQKWVLKVPAFVASMANRFVLTSFIAGEDVDSAHVDDQTVIRLAKHIAILHQQTNQHWGNCHSPKFTKQDWSMRLQNTIRYLVEQTKLPIDEHLLAEIFKKAADIQETSFVPMMFDLRWDQLRYCDNQALALIDLDAFVIAPKNLDLVLIANLLSPAQWKLFKQEYEMVIAWPDFTQQLPCYQLLLFLMQVLGETDLARWMRRI